MKKNSQDMEENMAGSLFYSMFRTPSPRCEHPKPDLSVSTLEERLSARPPGAPSRRPYVQGGLRSHLGRCGLFVTDVMFLLHQLRQLPVEYRPRVEL